MRLGIVQHNALSFLLQVCKFLPEFLPLTVHLLILKFFWAPRSSLQCFWSVHNKTQEWNILSKELHYIQSKTKEESRNTEPFCKAIVIIHPYGKSSSLQWDISSLASMLPQWVDESRQRNHPIESFPLCPSAMHPNTIQYKITSHNHKKERIKHMQNFSIVVRRLYGSSFLMF